MSVFSRILGKLGFPNTAASDAPSKSAAARATAAAPPTRTPAAARPASTAPAPPQPTVTSAPTAPQAPHAYGVVDVTKQLEERARSNAQQLNWRTSIVDLLKLLDIDSSLAARKELATELGCPAELMGDSAKMNMWLHKAVLRKLAENGGNVPKELTD